MRFEHHPPVRTDGGTDGNPLEQTVSKIEYRKQNQGNAEQFLADAGVVESVEDGPERSLTDTFSDRTATFIATFDGVVDVEEIGEMYDASPEDVTVPDRDYPAIKVRNRIYNWPSEAAFIADVASHNALLEMSDEWETFPPQQRVNMLRSIRSLWETCTICDGEISFDEKTVSSCCREFDVVTHRCTSCDAHYVELDPSEVDFGQQYQGIKPSE